MGWRSAAAHAPPRTTHVSAGSGGARKRRRPAHAAEYRSPSEPRLGELMAETPKVEGARAPGTNRGKATRGIENPASYLSQGIDKNLAKAARAAWKMDDERGPKRSGKSRRASVAAGYPIPMIPIPRSMALRGKGGGGGSGPDPTPPFFGPRGVAGCV
jgi:hypothetical protein